MTFRQLKLEKVTPGYWRVAFDNPPINLIDPDTIDDLSDLVTLLETDPDCRLVVFESRDPDFFLAHYDVLVDKQRTLGMTPAVSGMHPWPDVMVRLSRAPVVSVAAIRGRARGAGSEFVLACDIRFASAEKAVLGQFEVGIGAVPGGNPMARMAGLMGRGRTLEVVLGADDFPAPLAERYGYVNRAIPDAEFEAFVEHFARRLAGFDKQAIAETKRFVDQLSLPDDTVFPPALQAFFQSVARPETRARTIGLVQRGLQTRSDVELQLGASVANGPGASPAD
jgi:enoyl-CoA hydratase/carnithine racemase